MNAKVLSGAKEVLM